MRQNPDGGDNLLIYAALAFLLYQWWIGRGGAPLPLELPGAPVDPCARMY